MIIAIDGHAAAGKGTLARLLADAYDLAYLDTGAIYRSVARATLDAGVDPTEEAVVARIAERLAPDAYPDAALRTSEVGTASSVVAAHPAVRTAVLDFQRRFASNPPNRKAGAVLDGRDIGTVVLPDADIKLFVTASLDVRARRRWLERRETDADVTEDQVRDGLADRDRRDEARDSSPLKPAVDAHLIDTTELSIRGAFAVARRLVDAACAR